jgi:hypothetical protein
MKTVDARRQVSNMYSIAKAPLRADKVVSV